MDNSVSGKKRRFKRPVIIAFFVVCILLVIFAIGMLLSNNRQNRIKELLSLGQRYLTEEKYEDALLAFDQVINIDPNIPEGFIGRGYAEAGLKDYIPAIQDFNHAIALGQDLADLIDKTIEAGLIEAVSVGDLGAADDFLDATGYKDTFNPASGTAAKYILDAYDFLKGIQELCLSEEYDAVFETLANTDYRDIVARVISQNKYLYLIDENSGLMTAMYKIDRNTENFEDSMYMLYHGEHEELVREGSAIWLGFNDGNNYLAEGAWKDDVPQGRFETRSWQDTLNVSVTYRIIRGDVSEGLWNGGVQWIFDREGESEEFTPSFNNGEWVVKRTDSDGEKIADENAEGLILIAGDSDEIWGIAGFADQA